MDKKAISMMDVLVALIIIALAAMVLFAFSGKLSSLFREDADIETCRLSVLAQAQTRNVPVINVGTPGTIIPLDCPRRRLKIFEDKVEINEKKSSKYDFKRLTKDEINHILAEELRLCWYKMAEGRKNIFEYSWLAELKKVCLICSEIEFDNKLKGKSFDGLAEHLKLNRMPKSDVTYYDYLSKKQLEQYIDFAGIYLPWAHYTPWGYGTTDTISEDKIVTNEKYLIYFLAFKPDVLNKALQAYTSAYYIGLGKGNKLISECAELVN